MSGPVKAKVLTQRRLGPDVRLLALAEAGIASSARPGQFVHLLARDVSTSLDPLLRRPFSLHAVDRERGTLSLLYQVKGRGTAWLAERRPGDILDLLGPLGSGFPDPDSRETCLLVGGGLGIAPLFFLAAELRRMNREVELLAGAMNAEGLYRLEDFEAMGVKVVAATEDGSRGMRGLVTLPLAGRLSAGGAAGAAAGLVIYSCGPMNMLREVARMAEESGVPALVSLEREMACGTGVCRGCAVPARGENGPLYLRACTDGPVVQAKKVDWDAC